MILAFGGTTEGKALLTWLNASGLRYAYSTKTKVNVKVNALGIYLHGTMEPIDIESFIVKYKIDFLVDASHPFAVTLHQNIISAANNKQVAAFRIERAETLRENHRLIHYVDDYNEAMVIVDNINPAVVLALTGVQSIPPLTKLWKKYHAFLRILPKIDSLEMAECYQFKKEQLLASWPGKTVEEEIALIKKLKATIIITKESGANGGLPIKISAAKTTHTPIIILKRPKTTGYTKVFKQVDELNPYLNQSTFL